MATSQPLVCASLHLPPDPQPFLRVHEVSWRVFSPNLDCLRLALEATQDVNPEAVQIFYETRKVLREELLKVCKVLEFGQDVAERYYKVIEALEEKKPTQSPLYGVGLGAEMGMRCSREAQQALTVFRRELESAVDRVTTTTGDKNKKGSKSSLTSAKNIQLVSEIFNAIDECNGSLQQCHDQFAQLETQTRNENSIDSDPPSGEEIQVMRAKWQTYFDTVGGVWIHELKIADGILYASPDGPKDASGSREPRRNVPLWRALFQRQDKRGLIQPGNILEAPREPTLAGVIPGSPHEIRTSMINPVDATERLEAPGAEDTAVPNAAPSSGGTSNKPKAPFWRKIFRRTNSAHPPAVSGGPEASVPPPKVTFWRKFSRCATCVSTTPFR